MIHAVMYICIQSLRLRTLDNDIMVNFLFFVIDKCVISLSLFHRLLTDWVSAYRSMARFYMAGVISMHQPSSKVYPPMSSNLSYSGLYTLSLILSLSLSDSPSLTLSDSLSLFKVHPKFMLSRVFPIDIPNVII